MSLFPQALGGAVVVHSGGLVDLAASVFASNYVNGTDGNGIINLGGEVHCETTCRPVCTLCQQVDRDAPSPNPTQLPPNPTQVIPNTPPFPSADTTSGFSAPSFAIAISAGAIAILLTLLGCSILMVFRSCIKSRAAEQTSQQEVGTFELLDCANSGLPTRAANQLIVGSELDFIEPPEKCTQLPVSICTMMRSSPAATFVVNRAMRIIIWSPGERNRSCLTPHISAVSAL